MRNRLFTIVLLPVLLCFTGPVVAASMPETGYSKAQVEADLDQLYRSITRAAFDVHARTSKAALYMAYNRARAGITEDMTIESISRLFVTFVARADIAHLRVEWPAAMRTAFQDDDVQLLPLSYRMAEGKSWITRNLSGKPELRPGQQLIAINGVDIDTFNQPMRSLVAADNRYLENAIIEMQLPWLVWLAHGQMQTMTVTVLKADGSTEQISTHGITREQRSARESDDGTAGQLQLDWTSRSYKRINGSIGYIRPGPFYEPTLEDVYDTTKFSSFIDEAFDHMMRHRVASVIIDIRNNPGGDSSFSDLMVAWFADRQFRFNDDFSIRVSDETTASNRARLELSGGDENSISAQFDRVYRQRENGETFSYDLPYSQPRSGERFAGKVYLLINRHSYSNATNVAALIQDHEFGRVIGEETADLASTHGAMETFTLSHTGLTVGYPKALITRPNGNTDARGVIPDHAIRTPIVEQLNDPVLHEAIDWIKLDMKATSAIVSPKSGQ